MNPIIIAPNKPLIVALADSEGQYDFDVEQGQYQTTAGELFTLPRPAVVLLNALDPRPGEEIVITKLWSGRPGDKAQWTVALSPRSEQARAEAGEPDTLTAQLEASIEQSEQRKAIVAPPTPIRRPVKRQLAPEVQPRLFDRGTGTHGPAPAFQPEVPALPAILPAAARGRFKGEPIPANIATREILQFVNEDPNTANWSADARQDLASTILIASFKAGYIGLWERK